MKTKSETVVSKVHEEGDLPDGSTPTKQGLITVKEAAQSLVNRLKEIHADDRYKAVWFSYANHGGLYDGPQYDKHLERLEGALAKSGAAL